MIAKREIVPATKRPPTPRLLRSMLPVLLLLCFSALYVTYLQRTMQYDEAYSLRHYAASPDQALLAYTAPNNHLLHSLFLWFSTSFAGSSLIAVRLPALAAAMMALAMLYRLGMRIGGMRAGLVALALLGATFPFADYSINARGYTLSVLLTLMLMELTLFAPERMGRRRIYGLLVVSMGLVLTLPTMLMAIAGTVCWLLFGRKRSVKYSRMIPPLIVGAVAGTQFYMPSLLLQDTTQIFQTVSGADTSISPADLFISWVYLIFSPPVVGVLMAGGFVLFGFSVVRHHAYRSLGRWVGAQAVAAIAAIVALSFITERVLFARNLLYLLGPLSLLAGLGLSKIRGAEWAIPVLLVGTSVIAFQPLGRPTEVDKLLTLVERNITPTDLLLIGCCSEEPVWYHLQLSGDNELLNLTAAKNRLILIETAQTSVSDLKRNYHLEGEVWNCHWISDGSWSPFLVQACTQGE